VCLYAYYQHRLDQSETFNRQFAADFGRTYDNATKTLQADGQNARAQIQQELDPLRKLAAGGDVLTALQKSVGPSVWFVQTQDAAGQPSVGSAFVAASDNNQTLLICSFATVSAATRAPGPTITVSHGGEQQKATLWTWQPEKDLALLIIPKPNQPRLEFAPASPPLAIGERLFALSGLGGSGNAITQGFVADVSANAVQHDVPIGPAFQGGPLVDDQNHVVGVASRAFAPLGFPSDTVWFGVPGRSVCEKVLKCPGNDPANATQGAKP
jgi:S1-C subfamily serine protease